MHGKTAPDQPAHHAFALGDEATAVGVQVALLEPPVVPEPRVVHVPYLDRRQAHARRIATSDPISRAVNGA
jgi:hypothetical protein